MTPYQKRIDRLLRAELARYTYKPGWSLEFLEPSEVGGFGRMSWPLRIAYTAPDARTPPGRLREQAKIECTVPLPDYLAMELVDGDVDFASWLSVHLRKVEMHELDEWLRRDGQIIRDPHLPEEDAHG